MPALVRALKRVDLPTLGRPTMPHFKDMVNSLDGFAVQLLLGAGKVADGKFWPSQQAAGEGVFDVRHFFLARRVQHEVYNLLRQIEGARMADAEAQAPEIRGAELGLDVLQAVVPAIAATLFQADAAGRQVEFIVNDEDFARVDFVKVGQCRHRLTGAVHEGHRLQQPEVTGACRLAIELGLRGERCLEFVGQMVDKPEADVVSGRFIFQPGVTEADDQAGWVHGL